MRSKNPKYVSRPLCFYTHFLTLYISCNEDTVRTCPRIKSPISPHRIRTRSKNSSQFLACTPRGSDINYAWRSGGWLTIYSNCPQPYHHTETNKTIIRTFSPAALARARADRCTDESTTYISSPRAASRKTSGLVHRNSDLELQNESAAFTLDANALARVRLSCPDTITSTCLRLLYKTLTYVPRAILKNKLGVAGCRLQEFVSQSDLTWFLARFRSDDAFAKLSIMTVNGGINGQEQLDEVRPMLPQRGRCGCNISTCRLTLTSDTPSRSPTTVTRPQTSSIE